MEQEEETHSQTSYEIDIDTPIDDPPKSILSRKSSLRSMYSNAEHNANNISVNVGDANNPSWKDVIEALKIMEKKSFNRNQKLTAGYIFVLMMVMGIVQGFLSAIGSLTCQR